MLHPVRGESSRRVDPGAPSLCSQHRVIRTHCRRHHAQETIARAEESGELWSTNWAKEPLPFSGGVTAWPTAPSEHVFESRQPPPPPLAKASPSRTNVKRPGPKGGRNARPVAQEAGAPVADAAARRAARTAAIGRVPRPAVSTTPTSVRGQSGETRGETWGEAAGGDAALSEAAIRKVFLRFDTNTTGALSKKELRRALGELGLDLTAGEASAVLREADADGSGALSTKEFVVLCQRLGAIRKAPDGAALAVRPHARAAPARGGWP